MHSPRRPLHLGDDVPGAGVHDDLGAQPSANASFESSTSMATTRKPISQAYCTATCPRPPMPGIATHWPGRVSVTVALVLTQRFPAGAAVFATAASRPEPGVSDLVADLQVVNPFTESDDGAVALVAGNERRLRFDGPITMRCMEVGVTNTRGLQLHQRLAVTGRGQFQFGDLQWRTEFGDDSGTHGVGVGVCCQRGVDGLCHRSFAFCEI